MTSVFLSGRHCTFKFIFFLMRVPLSMLYVTFENSDRLGYLLAWISALPTFILFFIGAMVVLYSIYIYILYSTESANKVSPPHTVVVWIWYENNPYVFLRWLCYILLGQVFCEFLAVLLKDLLKGERPLASDRHGFDFGNPSSHTQFITFFAYMCLRRLYSKRRKTPTLIAILDATVLTGLVPLVALSRIYLEYHYLYQVFTGFFVGLLFAACWDRLAFPLVVDK